MKRNNHPVIIGPNGNRVPMFNHAHLKLHLHANGYSRIYWPGHCLAGADGNAWLHRVVLLDQIGSGTRGRHPCHWCGRKVSWFADWKSPRALTVDHLNGVKTDLSPGNLLPSCRSCNTRRARLGWRKLRAAA
jgi:hypothetical protein